MGRVYPNEVQRILYKPGGDVGKYARRLALDIAAESKRNAETRLGRNPADKPRTGALAKAYTVKVIPGTNQFRVTNSKRYSTAIEKGAGPHTIRARKVQYLQFTDRQGRLRRVKMVRHPGNPAFNLMADAVDLVLSRRGVFRRT